MDRLHWRSLLAKLSATATRDTHYCTCLGHLGQHNINRNDPICITSPKVAKASKEGDAISRALSIDIERKNTLLKVCYVPATSTTFLAFFLFFLAVVINSTNEANKAGGTCC